MVHNIRYPDSTRLDQSQPDYALFKLPNRPRGPGKPWGQGRTRSFKHHNIDNCNLDLHSKFLCALNPWLFPMILHLLERTFRWSVRKVHIKSRKINSFWGNIVGIGSRVSHLCSQRSVWVYVPNFRLPNIRESAFLFTLCFVGSATRGPYRYQNRIVHPNYVFPYTLSATQ